MKKKQKRTEIVTPFDWQNYTAMRAGDRTSGPARSPAPREKQRLTVRERVERILANRWGNPYCRPGAV